MMSNLQHHAMTEFRAAGWVDENGNYTDELQEAICKHILLLLQVFAKEGHSGTTAPYTINLFSKLAKFDPIVPLTGEDWEWNNVSEHWSDKNVAVYQNKRCGAVFKQTDRFDGQPYYLDGKIFWEWVSFDDVEGGKPFKSYYTNHASRVPIEFPYTPKSEYVFVPTERFPNEEL